MAGSMYPGQASLLDQTDSWNQRPQDMSMWPPSVEVSWVLVGFHLLTDGALPWSPFPPESQGVLMLVTDFPGQDAPFPQMLSGAMNPSH